MRNKPSNFSYFNKFLKQRMRFSGYYDGFKTKTYNNKKHYYACFTDVKEVVTEKEYRDHVFVEVEKGQINRMEHLSRETKYTFTAIVDKYKNKPQGKIWYVQESFGLNDLKKLQTVKEFSRNK